MRELGADGVFLDTMKEANPELTSALGEIALEGESTVPLARIGDHHLSWAQWFADSAVPGVIRARWFEQRHMLHHTRRWNRDHSDELRSAWLNGVGMLVWENVFGAWVGWNERDRGMLRRMTAIQRRHAGLLTTGEWTPLAARSADGSVVGSRWRRGDDELWALANIGSSRSQGRSSSPDARSSSRSPQPGLAAVTSAGVEVIGGGSSAYPARPTVRREPRPRERRRGARRVRRGARPAAARRPVPGARDRHLRRGALRRGMEAAPAALARVRRGRPPGASRAASRSACAR